jgi:hypothetical protein
VHNVMVAEPERIGDGLLSTLLDVLPDHFYVADSKMCIVYVNERESAGQMYALNLQGKMDRRQRESEVATPGAAKCQPISPEPYCSERCVPRSSAQP